MGSLSFFWVVVGLFLMLMEIAIPGLVAIFLGFAAILVGIALNFGFIEGLMSALTAWFIGSILLIVAFRELLLKLAQTGDVSIAELGDQNELVGQIAQVVDEVHPGSGGRILFQDSTWPARSLSGTLAPGTKVRILARVNLTFEVEAVQPNRA